MSFVKEALLKIEGNDNVESKISICLELHDHLEKYAEQNVKSKLMDFTCELYDKCIEHVDAKQYFYKLFPHTEFEHVKIEEKIIEEQKEMEEILNNIPEHQLQKEIDETYEKIQNSTNDMPELECEEYKIQHISEETKKFLDDEIDELLNGILEKKVIVDFNDVISKNIIFHDLELKSFAKVQFKLSFYDSIVNNINNKYGNTNEVKIHTSTDVCNRDKLIEQVKNDASLQTGYFVIKMNDIYYELHKKSTTTEKIKGYIYFYENNNVEMKHIGNYGELL
jgi:F0F1-type ATP synthase alpha subunit